METRILGLATAIGLIAALATGCPPAGDDAASAGARAAVELSGFSVEATRVPAACGVTEPGFSPMDTFVLEVTGGAPSPSAASLTLKLAASVTENASLPLAGELGAGGAADGGAEVETAASSGQRALLSFAPGTGPHALDGSGLASVVVTVDSMPRSDGQPLAARIQITFGDGLELDQTYAAPLRTAVVLCPVTGATPG